MKFTSEQYLEMADYFASIPSIEKSVYAETHEMLTQAAEMAKKFEQTEPVAWQFRGLSHVGLWLGLGSKECAVRAIMDEYETSALCTAPQPAIPVAQASWSIVSNVKNADGA